MTKQSWPSTKLSHDTSLNLMAFVAKEHEKLLWSSAKSVLHLHHSQEEVLYKELGKITGGAEFQFQVWQLNQFYLVSFSSKKIIIDFAKGQITDPT